MATNNRIAKTAPDYDWSMVPGFNDNLKMQKQSGKNSSQKSNKKTDPADGSVLSFNNRSERAPFGAQTRDMPHDQTKNRTITYNPLKVQAHSKGESLGTETKTSTGLISYNPRTQDELREMAENAVNPVYNAELEAIMGQRDEGTLALENEKTKRNELYEQNKVELDETFTKMRENTSNDALKRNLSRSSIVLGMLNEVDSEKAKSVSNLIQAYNNDITEIDSQVSLLERQFSAAKKRLDVDRAVKIQDRIDQLTTQQEDRITQITQINNQLETQLRQEKESKRRWEAEQEAQRKEREEAQKRWETDNQRAQKRWEDEMALQRERLAWQKQMEQQQLDQQKAAAAAAARAAASRSSGGGASSRSSSSGGGGRSRNEVKRIQRKLNIAGAGLDVDGILGPKTRAGIKQIQSMFNSVGAELAVDGIWGPKTEAAYNKYLTILAGQ